jgi:hypothetical protein
MAESKLPPNPGNGKLLKGKKGFQPSSAKAIRFADLYTTPGTKCFDNLTEAAIQAGYGNGNRAQACREGWKVRRRKHIEEYITNRYAEAGITPESILRNLARRFFSTKASTREVASLAPHMLDMVPGARVPKQVDVTATLSIEQLVLAAHKTLKEE